jgi:type III secretory pathway component EscV
VAPTASLDVDLKMTPVVMERRTADDPPKNPSTPEKTQNPQASQSAQAAAMSTPSMVRTGEIMLILSLLLIFLVACFVALHFYLRSRKRRNKKSGKTKDKKKTKKKAKGEADGPPELHSQQKKIAELVGTPICEIGDSEPRHEMEDVEVQEVMTPIDEPIGSAISTFGHTAIPAVVQPAPEPDIREFATYWSARM